MENFLTTLAEINDKINAFIWVKIGLVLLIGTGILMTCCTKWFQISHIGHWWQQTIGGMFRRDSGVHAKTDKKTISQFQALCTALAATIGTGNIAGVSAAIVIGGPGAVFWMWVAAFFGMMTNFSENVLGIYYRRRNSQGEWSGGAMYYLKDGLGGKKHCKTIGSVLAVLFSIFAILASFGIGNMGQINKIVLNMKSAFFGGVTATVGGMSVVSLACGIVLMILAALIVIGGLQRIATVAERVVPFMAVLYIIGSLIVMFTIEWRLALVIVIILPILLLVLILRRRKMSAVSKNVKARTAAINAEIESSLSGIRTAKAFANEAVELEKFDRANDRFKVSKREFHKEMGIFNGSLEFFMSILSVAVVTVGGALIMQDRMELVDLFTFTLYISTFTNPVRKLVNFAEMFANGFAGLNRFAELMRTEPSLQDAPDAVELKNVRGEIAVEHVDFAYDGDLDVLNDVSLHVAPGETVAIVGPSGGGKSTLCRLIPRFYDVTGGDIRIDGLDVRAVTQESLHHAIGVVQQDVFLFADTIGNNIRYGKPGATMDEVIAAAKRAEIYDDIMQMPDGFDTYVGERGTLLSGGQKQRVSIARIFLKNPPILILDEATSALDSVTESKIQSALDALAVGRTTLIIAHRLSTIRSASRILVVSGGKIVEQGTHEELMAHGGLYAELRKTQNLSV